MSISILDPLAASLASDSCQRRLESGRNNHGQQMCNIRDSTRDKQGDREENRILELKQVLGETQYRPGIYTQGTSDLSTPIRQTNG